MSDFQAPPPPNGHPAPMGFPGQPPQAPFQQPQFQQSQTAPAPQYGAPPAGFPAPPQMPQFGGAQPPAQPSFPPQSAPPPAAMPPNMGQAAAPPPPPAQAPSNRKGKRGAAPAGQAPQQSVMPTGAPPTGQFPPVPLPQFGGGAAPAPAMTQPQTVQAPSGIGELTAQVDKLGEMVALQGKLIEQLLHIVKGIDAATSITVRPYYNAALPGQPGQLSTEATFKEIGLPYPS